MRPAKEQTWHRACGSSSIPCTGRSTSWWTPRWRVSPSQPGGQAHRPRLGGLQRALEGDRRQGPRPTSPRLPGRSPLRQRGRGRRPGARLQRRRRRRGARSPAPGRGDGRRQEAGPSGVRVEKDRVDAWQGDLVAHEDLALNGLEAPFAGGSYVPEGSPAAAEGKAGQDDGTSRLHEGTPGAPAAAIRQANRTGLTAACRCSGRAGPTAHARSARARAGRRPPSGRRAPRSPPW